MDMLDAAVSIWNYISCQAAYRAVFATTVNMTQQAAIATIVARASTEMQRRH